MLIKKYGYSEDQIKREYIFPPNCSDGFSKFDIAVLKKKNNKVTNQILIVIEIKTHSLLKGLAKNQMEIIMSDADADYGMIFNGKEKLCIERKIRSSHEFYFLPILDHYGMKQRFAITHLPLEY